MTPPTEALTTARSFSRHPMLLLSVCFAAGILAAEAVSADASVTLAICVAGAVGAIAFKAESAATALIAVAFIAAGVLALLSEQASVRDDRIKVIYDNGTVVSGSAVEVEGVLAGRPEPSFEGEFLNLRAEKLRYRGEEHDVSGNVRVFMPSSDEADEPSVDELRTPHSAFRTLKYGSRIRVACRLEREDEYLNPGVVTKREMLDRQNIDATAAVKDALLIEHIADESVILPLAWVYDGRADLIDAFRQNLSPGAAGVMIASLLGDKYFLDKDTADTFRDGGTFHILVISGLHITFIGGLLLFFVRRLARNRWVQFGVTIAALWAYTLAVGADVPVVRASVMFTVVLFSYAIYRQSNLLNSLGFCALILLLWRPSDLFNPSFQLTFMSVAAIVACAYPLIERLRSIGTWTPTASRPFPPNVPDWLKRFCETIYWNNDAWSIESKTQIWTARLIKSPFKGERGIGTLRSMIRYTFEAALVSLIVQLWMLPLVIVYFHRVSFAGVLLNIWVGFFIALESFAAVTGGLIAPVNSLLAEPFFVVTDVLNWVMLSAPRLFSDNGWASFRLPAYSNAAAALYAGYFLPLLFFAVALTRWKPFDLAVSSWFIQKKMLTFTGVTFLLLASVLIFHPFSAPRPDGRLHIDLLDVGQGDSALVTFPGGETLLVDGGGRFDYRSKDDEAGEFEPDTMSIGEAVVSRVLWHRGYASIDHMLVTHADADHIEGLNDVARNFEVGSAWFGRIPADDPDLAQLVSVLQWREIALETIARGERFTFGKAVVEVLYPLATNDANAPSDNDHSVVVRIVYGARAFLLTGDIEEGAEQALLNSGGTLRADFVKVAHHGSRTSSTQSFIDAVGPRYAVISVGRSSPFGHPHPEVVERWRKSGAQVLTTGTNGMISVSTDGRDLEIETFRK